MSNSYGSNSYGSVPPVEHHLAVPTTDTTAVAASDATDGTVDVAKDLAGHVAQGAKEAGKNVTGVAKDEAAKVASEAKSQVKDLYSQTKTELSDQAGTQQKRAATGLRALSEELQSMANGEGGSGVASDIVQQVASRASGVASWLDNRDPASLLSEVSDFARRRPGTFIAIAAATGLLAGRLTRSVVEEGKNSEAKEAARPTATTPATASYTGVPPTTGPYASTEDFPSRETVVGQPGGIYGSETTGTKTSYLGGETSR